MDSPWLIIGFTTYFTLLIVVALVGASRMRDMSEYVLGGRRLGSFTAALSAGSSTTSAWTMLALPALAFTDGAVSVWVPIAAAIGVLLSWQVIARRLRRYTIEANNVLTIPEFFEVRFGDKTGILRSLTSFITVFFVVFYVSSGLVGGSKLLETIFGVEPNTGVLLTFFAVASYTLIGGFLAVSRTDVFQALLMLVSLLPNRRRSDRFVGRPVHGRGRPRRKLPESPHRRRWSGHHLCLSALCNGMGFRRFWRAANIAALHGD